MDHITPTGAHDIRFPANVLVIEDDADDFLMLQEMMDRLVQEYPEKDFHFAWASSYEEGLVKLKARKWDFFIVDHVLRNSAKTGLDFINDTYKNGYDIPALMITGHVGLKFDTNDFKTLGTRNLRIIAKQNLNWEVLQGNVLEIIEKHGALQKKEKVTSVLVVEDDEDDFEMMRQLFVDHPEMIIDIPFCMVQVADYESAIEQLVGNDWDLFIVDYKLLGYGTGLDFVHAVRARGVHVPALLVSGMRNIPFTDVDKADMESGKLVFIPKSKLTWELLVDRLGHAMVAFK